MAIPILSLVVWLPFLGFVATILAGTTLRRARSIALAVSIAGTGVVAVPPPPVPAPSLAAALPGSVTIAGGAQTFLYVEQFNWIPSLGISYVMGLDGLSLPLVVLTPLLTTLAIAFSWGKEHRPREFFGLLLLMEWSILGVFVTLDFFLFFVFWELVP